MNEQWIGRLTERGAVDGEVVRLEPLAPAHLDTLAVIAQDDDLWRWTISNLCRRPDFDAYMAYAFSAREHGSAFPYAIVHRESGRVVGTTRYGAMEALHRRVEVGWTWIDRAFQRTAVNTEGKYLLLRNAFELLGCIRVELKTDVLNERSRAAILRLGAVEEGVLRSHIITSTGRVRDTIYYSILEREWPEVRSGLEARLGRTAAQRA